MRSDFFNPVKFFRYFDFCWKFIIPVMMHLTGYYLDLWIEWLML
jgi:hypothetical protein